MKHFRWLRRSNITTRLVTGFALICVFVMAIGWIGIFSANTSNDNLGSAAVQMRSVKYLADTHLNILLVERSLLSGAFQLDPALQARDLQAADVGLQNLDVAFQQFLQNDPGHTDEENRDIAIFQQTEQTWRASIAQIMPIIRLQSVTANAQAHAFFNGAWKMQSQTLLQTIG
ncbi:MAG: Tar ligand binding domain-containing protein, partial [Ktedonobacterales bacterium]|nr:Tar ligand binding domain-containing protein [Ktedonobacterales bacterium]